MKNFIVIGGTSGIGLEITRLLNQEGNHIYVYSRSNKNLEGLNNTEHFKLDLTKTDFQLADIPNSVDGLVYCPGTINLRPFHRLKRDDFLYDFEINVLGAVSSIQQVISSFNKGASIIMFSTVAVQKGMPFHSSIASSKGAIEGLVRALAAELAPKIRVNAIAPSLTDTPLAQRLLNTEEKRKNSANRHPLNRIGDPKDLASAAVFLLNTESNWITGQVLHIDGGLSTLQ